MKVTLRANFIWSFFGNAVYAACQFAMLIAIAKLGNKEMVGQFALGLAIGTPILLLMNLGLRRAQVTDAKREYSFAHYLGIRLCFVILASLIIVTIVGFSSYAPETKLAVLFIGIAKCFESLSDVFYGLLQQQERMARIAISMCIKGILSLCALSVGVYLTHRVVPGIIAMAVCWGLLFVLYDVHAVAMVEGRGRLSFAEIGKLLRETYASLCDAPTVARLKGLVLLTLPLGIVETLDTLNMNIPRYFIQNALGEGQLGIYSAISALVLAVGSTIALALSQTTLPRLSKYYVSDFMAFTSLLVKLFLISAGLGLIGITLSIVAGKKILTLLYRPEYAAYNHVFFWTMIAAAIWYLAGFSFCALTAARRFKVQLAIFAVSCTITAVCSWLLIPKFGLLGAAWTLNIGMAVRLLLYLVVLSTVFWARLRNKTAAKVELLVEQPVGQR